MNTSVKKASLREALVILFIILVIIMIPALLGASLVSAVFLTWPAIYLISRIMKFDWPNVMRAGFDGIRGQMGVFMILSSVGVLISAMLVSGALPTIIYYGLNLISPKYFLLSTILINFFLAAVMGTSFGTAASAGVAMMSIGIAMNINPGMVAGAVICGVMFGEKVTPLSSTSNVAASSCGVPIMKHIKGLMQTMLLPFIITCGIFTYLGFQLDTSKYTPGVVNEILGIVSSEFKISLITLLPIIVMVGLLLIKIDTIPALMLGGVSGIVIGYFYQGIDFVKIINAMYSGFTASTGNVIVDGLLNRGGVTSMSSTFYLLFFAIGMGAMLNELGVTSILVATIEKKINTTPKLIFVTMFASYLGAVLTCSSSAAHVINGSIFTQIYKDKNVDTMVLSRTLEDTATMGALLIPWHVFTVYFMGALSVTFAQIVPYLYMGWLVPIMTTFFAITGLTVTHTEKIDVPAVNQKME